MDDDDVSCSTALIIVLKGVDWMPFLLDVFQSILMVLIFWLVWINREYIVVNRSPREERGDE